MYHQSYPKGVSTGSRPSLHCWNNITHDLKLWFTKHRPCQDYITVYKRDVMSFLRSDSERELECKLEAMSGAWSKAIFNYFSKFVLVPLDVYDPYSGVTNNISESTNCVIKDLLQWKEVPLGVIVFVYSGAPELLPRWDSFCMCTYWYSRTTIQFMRLRTWGHSLAEECTWATTDSTTDKAHDHRECRHIDYGWCPGK